MTGAGIQPIDPAPQKRNPEGSSESGKPPEITNASPRATFIMPSVGMNGCGRGSLVSRIPLMAPSAEPMASAATTLIRGGTPACISRATMTQQSPSTEPTDKSIPPVIMTVNCPRETSALTADWRQTFSRLSAVRNRSDAAPSAPHRISRPNKGPNLRSRLAGDNAGKPTLFNRLTRANVLADPRMFATLDPAVRPLLLPSRRRVLVGDTVGFRSEERRVGKEC